MKCYARRFVRFAVVSASFILIASQSHADLILNGSFENSTGGAPDDWTSSGNLLVINSQGETDGSNAIAFSFGNLPSNGEISQSFATSAGTAYNLSFDFGKYSINQPVQFARLDVDVFDGTGFAGVQLLDQTVADGTPKSGDPDSSDSSDVYSAFQFEFTANGGVTTLRFTDVSDPQGAGGGFDAMLDNVSVSAVPEPSSLALLTMSFTAYGIVASRRRKHRC